MSEELDKYSNIKFNKDYSELSEDEKLIIISEFGSVFGKTVLEKYNVNNNECINNIDLDNKYMLLSKPYKLQKSKGIIFISSFLILGPIINIIYLNFFQFETGISQLGILFLIVITLILLFMIFISTIKIVVLDDEIVIGRKIIKYTDISGTYYIDSQGRNNRGIYINENSGKIHKYSILLYDEKEIKELCEFINYKVKNIQMG